VLYSFQPIVQGIRLPDRYAPNSCQQGEIIPCQLRLAFEDHHKTSLSWGSFLCEDGNGDGDIRGHVMKQIATGNNVKPPTTNDAHET